MTHTTTRRSEEKLERGRQLHDVDMRYLQFRSEAYESLMRVYGEFQSLSIEVYNRGDLEGDDLRFEEIKSAIIYSASKLLAYYPSNQRLYDAATQIISHADRESFVCNLVIYSRANIDEITLILHEQNPISSGAKSK